MIQRNILALLVAQLAIGGMACGPQVRWDRSTSEGSGGGDSGGGGAGGFGAGGFGAAGSGAAGSGAAGSGAAGSGAAGSGAAGGATGMGGIGGTGGSGGTGDCAGCEVNEECDGAGHCVEVLATGLNSPEEIAVDSANVYWTSFSDGTVMKCAVSGCGGAPTVLASGQPYPQAIALDATHVYWQNHGMSGTDGSVMKCAIGGCAGTPAPLLTNINVNAIAVQNGQLYLTKVTPQPGGAGRLQRCPTSGCSNTPIELAQVQGVPFGLAARGMTVTWGAHPTTTGVPSSVMICDSTACTPTELASSATVGPRSMAMDAVNVHWTNEDFSIMKCPLTGCDGLIPITMASVGDVGGVPHAIATDGVNVYWTNLAMGGTPAVKKCPVSGCGNGPITLAAAPGIQSPHGITVDATHVYWVDAFAGKVMRAKK